MPKTDKSIVADNTEGKSESKAEASSKVETTLPLEQKLAALAELEALKKKLSQIENQRDTEKQFNRRLELNDQFKVISKALAVQREKLNSDINGH